MRLIFAGTPETSVPSLRALLEGPHDVVAVLTRPDAPTGRGRRMMPSPVRAVAEDAGIEVLTPRTLRDQTLQQHLRELAPDVAPVVAYGALVPPETLVIPRCGWINLHFSALPKWRGAAPAQRAVLAGEHRTGITTFRLEAGLDTGDILMQDETGIGDTETAGELLDRLAHAGADLLARSLDAIADGSARFTPQDPAGATSAPKLTAAEAAIDFARPRPEVSAHIRGMSPHPGAWTLRHGERTKILGVTAQAPPSGLHLAPGALAATKQALFVGTGTEPLGLGTISSPGRRPLPAADWARGAHLADHDRFETAEIGQESR